MNDLVTTEEQPRPGAEALVHRSQAALDDVHGYALNELARLERMIADVKLSIMEKKNRATAETRAYVESVDDAVRAARSIEEAVQRIGETA